MKEPVSSFEEDRQLIVDLFWSNRTEWKIYEFLEDDQLTWIDIPLVNTHIMKQLKAMKPIMDDNFMCLKCIKIMRIKPLSKICLENNFERGRAGKRVCW
jgi:N utilization substance protein B